MKLATARAVVFTGYALLGLGVTAALGLLVYVIVTEEYLRLSFLVVACSILVYALFWWLAKLWVWADNLVEQSRRK